MLVLMTVTHLPTRLSSPLANLVAVSAAELCAAVGLHGWLARAASAGQVSTPCGWPLAARQVISTHGAVVFRSRDQMVGCHADQPAGVNLMRFTRGVLACLLASLVLPYRQSPLTLCRCTSVHAGQPGGIVWGQARASGIV
jgi:hypothetical protein